MLMNALILELSVKQWSIDISSTCQDSGDKICPFSPDDVLHTPGRGLHLFLGLGDAADCVLDNPWGKMCNL